MLGFVIVGLFVLTWGGSADLALRPHRGKVDRQHPSLRRLTRPTVPDDPSGYDEVTCGHSCWCHRIELTAI
jgi:hypothetical protein